MVKVGIVEQTPAASGNCLELKITKTPKHLFLHVDPEKKESIKSGQKL